MHEVKQTTPKNASSHRQEVSFLKTIDILKGFTRDQLEDVLDQKEKVTIKSGKTLFRQGDPGDSIYLVRQGTLEAFITRENCSETVVSTIHPGQTIGEMQILFHGLRTAGVRTVTPCVLYKLSSKVFRKNAESSRDSMEQIIGIIRHRLRRDQLAETLPALFGTLDASSLNEIQTLVQWVDLPAGDFLFMQGDESDTAYIVINGTLHAYSGDTDQPQRLFLREMTRGDCIGEMGVLSEEKRSASILAARDSLLICFSKQNFQKIMVKYPAVSRQITKLLIKRLQNPSHGSRPEKNTTKIAVIPAGQPFPISEFVQTLSSALAPFGPVLHLSSRSVDTWLGARGIAQVEKDDPRTLSLMAWLDKQETHYRFVLFESDLNLSGWTHRSIARADHLILVGKAGASPDLGPIEQQFLNKDTGITKVTQTLVLLHENGAFPEKTQAWLNKRKIQKHHHIHLEQNQDMERLARFITNNAVGLVLGGGGARGFAHIGVIQALMEAGIPIDMVGGTSMGAIISAQYAMGWDIETIVKKNKNAWVKERPLNDYTLPIYSILSGKKVNRNSKKAFGNQRIEDLPINFFCVSSNLTQACPLIHQQGPVWKAVRASGSLPGIFRPWVSGSDLLVDGGIMNNLPGDIMKKQNNGILLIVDVSLAEDMEVHHTSIPSPWRTAWKKLSPFTHSAKDPTMLDILVRSTMLASLYKKEQVKKLADLYFSPPVQAFGLLEFKAIEEIIQTGYEYAEKKIKIMKKEGSLPPQWLLEC